MNRSGIGLVALVVLAGAVALAAIWELWLSGVWGARAGAGAGPEVVATGVIVALALAASLGATLRAVAPPRAEKPEGEEIDLSGLGGWARDAVIAIDADGRVISWNEAAEAMFGYGLDEMYGEPLTRIMPERYRAAHEAGLARVNAGGEPRYIGRTVELAGLRDNGEEFPLELSLSTWQAGARPYYGAIIRDVSERKRAEEALRRSEERLRKLVESVPDAVVVIDVEGRIVSWNPAARKLFGYEEAEVIGTNVTRLMPDRYRAAHAAGLRRFRETGSGPLLGKTVALEGLDRDGTEFPLELSLGSWSVGEELFFSSIIRARRAPQQR